MISESILLFVKGRHSLEDLLTEGARILRKNLLLTTNPTLGLGSSSQLDNSLDFFACHPGIVASRYCLLNAAIS